MECANFFDTSSSMEFHGWMRYRRLSSITKQFQWVLYMLQTPPRSMQLQNFYIWWQNRFHGIPWDYSCHRNWRTSSSMEFHGTARVSEIGTLQVLWNLMNFSCQRIWRTPSSMEFHGIPRNCSYQRNKHTSSSMEFHGTARVSEIGTPQAPWNSMEFHLAAPNHNLEILSSK